jgi:hypothetical protein
VIATRTAAALAVLVLALAGCGERDEPAAVRAPIAYEAHGVAVDLPPGWGHADASLTPGLTDPREVLSVATFPLHYRPVGCNHLPSSALADLGPRDAFVTLQERGLDPASAWTDFPPRPAHFGPELGGPSEAAECVPSARFTDHWFGVTAGDRHFHVEVAFGPRAPAATREEAWAVLDSLRVDPRVQPDWAASG